jgi:hypothetical protein
MLWAFRAKIGGIDRSAKLAEKLGVDGLVVSDGEKSASDPALIGDHDVEPTVAAKARQRFRGAGDDMNLGGIIAKIRFSHEGAIAIQEDSAILLQQLGAFHWRAKENDFGSWPEALLE